MKQILILLTLFIFSASGNAQESKKQAQIDSLNEIIFNPNSHDTLIVKAYYEYTEIIIYSNIDTIFPICKKIEDISLKNLQHDLNESDRLFFLKYMSNAQNSIGVVFYFKGDIQTALVHFNKSLKTKRMIGDNLGIAESINNIGFIYSSQGNTDKALTYYLKSLAIRKNIGDKKEIAISLINIGAIYHKVANFSKAIDYYQKALIIDTELKDYSSLALVLNNIGTVYAYMGDHNSALKQYHKSLSYIEKTNQKIDLANAHGNIGYIYLKKKEYRHSLVYLLKALNYSRIHSSRNNMTNTILHNISLVYSGLNLSDSALYFSSKSIELSKRIGDKRSIASTSNNIGAIYYKINNFTKSLENYKFAYTTLKKINAPHYLSVTLIGLIKVNNSINNYDQAELYLSELLKLKEQDINVNYVVLTEREKELYFNTLNEVFKLYYNFTNKHSKNKPYLTELAYNLTLRNKGLLLKSSTAMKNSILNSNDTNLIDDYNEWISLKKNIAKLYSQGKKTNLLDEKANIIEKNLIKNSSVYNDFYNIKKLSWKEVQLELNHNEVAIEFINFPETDSARTDQIRYAALIVKQNSEYPEMIELCTEKELENVIGKIQGNNLNYINAVYGTNKNPNTKLYELIWKPLENSLVKIKNIYLSPSGLLHKISFSSLSMSNNVFLCDLYNINLKSTTAKIIGNDKFELTNSSSISLFGGVNYNSENSKREVWSYLPGTLTEVENINSKLKKKKLNVNIYKGDEASENNFKKMAVNSNIIHIATHGFFYPDPNKISTLFTTTQETEKGELNFRGGSNQYGLWNFVKNKNPLMRSGIVLTGANEVWVDTDHSRENDGVLTAQEVSLLNMNKTELIVLSACETGLGEIRGAEGVYGLQRAFKMAGVKFIIMSLWQVPDKETSEFMDLFYKMLLKSNAIKYAFNKTQLIMRKKYDPYYWAAFVLID